MSYGFVTAAVPVGSVFLIVAIVANLVEAWRSPHGLRIFTGASQNPEETAL
jgi:TRAP-type C4-dicarboxylate transport system permease small subunit